MKVTNGCRKSVGLTGPGSSEKRPLKGRREKTTVEMEKYE